MNDRRLTTAWETTGITENELKRLAAVREYLYEHFPSASIGDSYDATRLAQAFRIEELTETYTAVILTGFLDDYPQSETKSVLTRHALADHLRAAKGADVLVTIWGIEGKDNE